MLPTRFAPYIFAVIQSGLTTLIATGIATGAIQGDFVGQWIRSWLIAWSTMIPIVLLAAPVILAWVRRIAVR